MSDVSDSADRSALALASDPNTPLETLAELAQSHPEVRPQIALNPSTYTGLLEWLAQLQDPLVDAALTVRTGVPPRR
jgi:hypothetical protein